MNKTIELQELADLIEKHITTGCEVSLVVKKKRRVTKRMSFKVKAVEEKDVVKIPCVIVPRSPFWPKEDA